MGMMRKEAGMAASWKLPHDAQAIFNDVIIQKCCGTCATNNLVL